MTGPRLRQNHARPVTYDDYLTEQAEDAWYANEGQQRKPTPPDRCVVCGHETTAGDLCLTCDTGRRHQ